MSKGDEKSLVLLECAIAREAGSTSRKMLLVGAESRCLRLSYELLSQSVGRQASQVDSTVESFRLLQSRILPR